ncbi:MAG: CapA family protein [Deltaproteobacteria bacterium]|nr:CapA family protein [Deltaproteobacteria bacterium]
MRHLPGAAGLLALFALASIAGCGPRMIETGATAFEADAGPADAGAPEAGDGDAGADAGAGTDAALPLDTGVADPRVPPTGTFPYVFKDDDRAPQWARFRAEGLTGDEVLASFPDYMKKFTEKKRTAPSAEREYFERQRKLQAAVRAAGSVPSGAVTARIGLAGDIMWISDSWDTFLDPVLRERMEKDDLWLGNLETPIAASVEVGVTMAGLPVFNSAPGLVRSFRRDDGAPLFAALSFSNNHTLDHGDAAARETLDFLASEGIAAAGGRTAPGSRFVGLEVDGIRLGVYAATWGINDMTLLDSTALEIDVVPGLAPPGARQVDLTEAREVLSEMALGGVDLSILLLHWGHEYEMFPDPVQMVVARELVWAGADIIVGAHSHVPQPAELCFVNGAEAKYAADHPDLEATRADGGCVLAGAPGPPRKALVLYSLGNFATAMSTELCRAGTYCSLEVFRNTDGAVDWLMPRHGFVYNAPEAPPDGTRRTLKLSDYLAANCFADACPAVTQDEIAYLREHLGSDLGLAEE